MRQAAALLILFLSPSLTGTGFSQTSGSASSIVGPSFDQTAAWLQRQLREAGADTVVVQPTTGPTRTEVYEIPRAVVARCQASVTTSKRDNRYEFSPPPITYILNLKDLDISKLSVRQVGHLDATASKASFTLLLSAASAASQFVRDIQGRRTDIRLFLLHFRDERATARIANAFRHVAALCGAPDAAPAATPIEGRYVQRYRNSTGYLDIAKDGTFVGDDDGPVTGSYTRQPQGITLASTNRPPQRAFLAGNAILLETWDAWEPQGSAPDAPASRQTSNVQSTTSTISPSSIQTQPSPASSAPSKLTNADVVQLVSVGLSDSIVTASIRQAAVRDFDLSPSGLISLKKAGVSDVVILTMQTPAAAQPPSPQESGHGPSLGPGRYVRKGSSDYMDVKADGTFDLQQLGKSYRGTYTLQGDTVTLQISNGPTNSGRVNGTVITDPSGSVWERLNALNQPNVPAVPTQPDPCAGIEFLGLFKNEIFDRAMGGGVIEWLAKVRNNTAVTKIVIVGWRDIYHEQKRAQVQIRGGEISSLRLDLTQAKIIPPVADGRVISCR